MKPFHDITFCPTGINDEALSRALSKKIIKLGGNYSKDLTRQVNVLICGSKDTNKYKFAVRNRHDIIFIDPGAVEVFYERWLTGEDIKDSLNLLKDRYCNRPLSNVLVFIGRIQNYPIQELHDLCQLSGCYKCYTTRFVKDARKPDRGDVVFISDSLNGSRVQAAVELNLPVIHYKWLLDCHRRNATLEYDPFYLVTKIPEDMPFDKIGLEACNCWDELIPAISEQQKAIAGNPLTRFKSKGDKIWEKVMSIDQSRKKDPFIFETLPQNDKSEATKNLVFQNCSFKISEKFASAHYSILLRVIEQNGGIISESAEYVIVPSNVPLNECDEKFSGMIVTEFFIERCLHYKKLISPPDTWSRPFFITRDILLKPSKHLLHDTKDLKIAITGFHGVELLHLTKILQIMEPIGIKLTNYLNKSTDLLLINLSALPSIPRTHALWQNHYGDLFALQNTNDSNSKSQILRNSLKRKIEFIKQSHSIPGVTPSFLFEIFKKSTTLSNTKKDSVYLNNINWCIICPRGIKENFMIELSPKFTLGHKKEVPFQTVSTSLKPAIKETRVEFLQKIKESEIVRLDTRKRTKSELDLPPQSISGSQSKKIHPNTGTETEKIVRPPSWGNLMSNEMHDDPNKSIEFTNDQPNIDTANYTQVTYGTAASVDHKPVRKLTRKHIKDIGI